MRKNIICFLIVYLIIITIVYSIPAPFTLALNHETKECSMYWAGDEFTYYELPPGWKSYYINYSNGLVETEIGSCIISPRSETPGFEECCNQLGYKYIQGNIGKKAEERIIEKSLINFNLIITILAITMAIVICLFQIKRSKKF